MTLEVIMFIITAAIYPAPRYNIVVSIEFSPLSSVELTNSWYQLHNGDYKGILKHSFGKQLPANLLQLLF